MKKQQFSTMVAVLTATAATFLGMIWLISPPVSKAVPPALAARRSQVTTATTPMPHFTDNPLFEPNEVVPVDAASVDNTTAGTWVIERVDTGGQDVVGLYTSLALDEGGYPHISYFDDSNEALKYAYEDTDGWHIETMVAGLGYRGGYTSLALDEDGYPHISYVDYTDTDLEYAYQDADGWHNETVAETDYYVDGYYNSLALDDGHFSHISYFYAYDDYNLKHAFRDADGWHIGTVAVLGRVGLFSSLALDDNGFPHISYWHFSDYYNSSLEYAYYDADGWHVVLGVDEGQVGRYTSLALDDSGYPHISYHASRYGTLWNTLAYAYWNGTTWVKENADYGGDDPVGAYTSLALDKDDYPHISYFDSSNSALKYAYKDGSGWHKQTLDNDGEVGRYTSLALGASGYPHISYHDTGDGDLKYAYYAGPPVAAFTASPTTGPRPLTVVFTDTSTGVVDTWFWWFGDGLTSTLESPTHTYTMIGAYTVTLAVNGPDGSDILSRTRFITVYEPVMAAFTALPTSGFAPLTVDFTNTSAGDYTTSLWNFGDGGTSTQTSPTYTYTIPAVYTVTLTVSGPGGTDTVSHRNYVTVYQPVQANFSATPRAGTPPLIVDFTDLSIGPVASWAWDFGDGTVGTLRYPGHVYMTGTYTVALTVRAAGGSAALPGGTDTLTRTNYIRAQAYNQVYLPLVLRSQ
jgi:PKD repeat protein